MAPTFTSFLLFKLKSRSKTLRPPSPALLRTNDPPTEQDISRIRDAIARVENKLKKKRTRTSQQSYTKFLEAHKAILSPYRRLPTELIVEIFLYYHESPVDPKYNVVPWILAHICHRWRIIALNTPALWRNLPPMRLVAVERPQLKWHIARLSTLLARSGNSPITFCLTKMETATLDDEIVTMLSEHSERWESICLTICEKVCEHFSRIKGRVSALRSLRLLLTRTGSLSFDMFEVAPKLRQVSLGSLTWPGIVKLPWNQITDFTEDASRTDHITTVFHSSAEALQRLNFITDQSWALFDGTAVIRPTTLPNLTCLALQTPFETGLKSLLDALTVPALQELVLKIFTDQSLTQEVVNLLTRSQCMLRKLTIHTSPAQGIERVLAAAPLLTTLDINDPAPNLICALTGVNAGREWTLVPYLDSLTIRVGVKFALLSELGRLARVRCDLALEGAAAAEPVHVHRLQEFNVACPLLAQNVDRGFDVWAAAQFAQHCFETFGLGGAGDPALKEAKKRLDGELCEISAVNKNSTMSRKARLVKLAKHVDILIDHLEHFDVAPESIIYLYVRTLSPHRTYGV